MRNNLRKIISEKKLNIGEVVDKVGCSRSYFYDLMDGKSTPSITYAWRIAEALGESIDTVFPKEV